VATRSERVIGQVTVNDQNQRRRSGPPKWNPDDGGFGGDVVSALPFRRFVNLAQKRGARFLKHRKSDGYSDSRRQYNQKNDLVAIATIIASRCRLVGVEQADSEIDIAS
jgi:hypothetical protein